MITVKCDLCSNHIVMDGHAGSAPYGHDLICAAATILFYSLADRLEQLDIQGKATADITHREGFADVSCHPKNGYDEEVRHYFDFCIAGLYLLAHDYPEYIKIIRQS